MNYQEIADEIRLCENGGDNEELAQKLERLSAQAQKHRWTVDELELLREGIGMKMCLVETGCAYLRARDLEAMGPEAAKRSEGKIKALDSDQMQLILTLEGIRKKLGVP